MTNSPANRTVRCVSFMWDQRHSSLGAIFAVCLITLLIFTVGLSTICTNWMLGYAWICFFLWFMGATLASPLRVRRASRATQLLHGGAYVLAWSWFGLAIFPADLWSRNDALWFAYLGTAVGIACWKKFVHMWLLRSLIRGALREVAGCPWLVAFSAGVSIDDSVPKAPLLCKCLSIVSSIRSFHLFARFHSSMYGAIWNSQVCVEEVQYATDGRVRKLRDALSTKHLEEVYRCALNAAEAFECESAVCSAIAVQTGESVDDSIVRARALLVLESLLLAWLATDGKAASAVRAFEQGVSKWDSLAPLLARSASPIKLTSVLKLHDRDLLSFAADRQVDAFHNFVVGMAYACVCIRGRYFRLANATLERVARDFADSPEKTSGGAKVLQTEATRIAHAFGAEVARAVWSTSHEGERAPSGDSSKPSGAGIRASVQAQRTHEMGQHGRGGDHPSIAPERDSRARISTELAGYLAPPTEPREVGRGIATVALAVLMLTIFVLLTNWNPPTNRIQHFFDVPSFGLVAASEITAQAMVEKTATILIGDKDDGVRTINLDTFRVDREDGPPATGPGGSVTHLATTANGTAFAIFETDPQHGPGVALRTSEGRWSTVLSASVARIDGADVEALVPNLGRPLFLLKGESPRIAEYDESARSLRFATTTGPAIEGAVVDVAATTGRTTSGRAIVATNAPTRVYLLESKANEREISIKEFSRLSLEGGHEASSIAIASSGTAVLVCKDGSAWEADANNVEKPWKQIRGGDQGLVLDGIQLAGLATGRSELWLFRKVGDKTTVWERSLPSSPSAPGHGAGWVQSELPPNIDPIVPGRTMFCELQGDGGVLLLTPAVDEKKMGAATHFQMTRSGTQESITCEVIPLGGKLLDADRAEGTLIALVESEDVNHSGVKTRTVVRFGEVGKPSKSQTAVSSTIFDEPATRLLESNNKIVAVGSVEQSNFLLFEDGKFVHFDGKTESLNWASAQQKSIVGKINFTSPVVDGTIDAPNGTPRVMLLSGNGSVDKGPIYKEDEVELKRIIDTSSGRPSSKELASTKGVITDANNFCLATKDALWRFDLQHASAPWSKVQTEFSEEPFFAIDSAGTPLFMGRTKVASKEVRAFGSDGKPTDWAATEVHDLVPGVGIAAFGSDKDGVLYSFDKARGKQAHFRSTDSGPLEVQSVAVRPEYLDFRASRTLHSFSRTDGSWDKSEAFDSDCSFTVGGMRASPILFLVPKSKGIPRWLPTGMAAGKLQKLGSISLRKAVSTTDGVIGLTGDIGNGIAFSSVEAVPPNEFVSTEAKDAKINIARPKAIVDFGNSFWIQSDADKLYRYTPSQLKTEIVQTGGLSVDALDATKESFLFAKSNNEILTFKDANSTKAAAQVSVKDLLAMGRPLGSFIPAITNGGGLFRVDVGTSTPLLASRQPELSIGKIDRVLAMGDSLYVYSGNAGFERTASGLDPFKPLPHVTTAPTRILPNGDEIWLESSEGWMCQGDGVKVGKSIGWFSDGKLLSMSSWFKDAPDGFGDLRGFHQLDDRRLLMLGTESIAIFHPSTRSFEQIDGAKGKASDFGDGTALYKAGSGNFLWKPRGKVYELVAGGDSTFKILPRCGGKVVSSLAIVSNRLVGFVDGLLYYEDGTLLPNQPQPASGAPLEIGQVLTDEQGRMYRLSRDGVVDLFDINTAAQRPEIEKGMKHLAFHGKDVIWCKETTPWFGGSDFELRFSISDGLRVITNSGTSQPIRKPDEIPGKIVAQIPMTGIVLCEFEREKYRLYDFVSAKKLSAEASGKLVGATKDGFYILAQGSKELIRVDREGKKKSVGAEKIVATCSVDGSVDAFALKDRTASRIDPITLEYQQAKVEPYSTPMLVATIDEKATLYVSPTKFVLKGTDSIVSTERGNPFGKVVGLQVFQSSSAITVLDDAKKQILVVASKQGEQWTLSNSGLAEAPNATTRAEALGAEYTPKPAGKTEGDRVKVERGTLEPSTGLILEEQVLAIRLDVGVISKQNGLLAWEQLSKCTDPWQYREIAKSFTQLLGSKHPHMGDAILQPADSGIPPHKEYVACAAFSSKDFVLVDALGQLWHQHAGDELPNFIQKVGKQAKFSIDPADKGALFVSFDKTRYRLTISGDRVQSKLDQSTNRELLPDWTHVGGRYGLLEWGPSVASTPIKFFLRCNDKEKFPIKPTASGFDCFMASELGTFAKGQAFVKLGVKDKAVFAPVRENGVDWMNASVKNPAEFKQFSSVEPPKITKLSDGTEFRLNGESVICRIGEMEFKFDSNIKRFQCDSGIAETIQNGEFLVTATKSGQLIKRRLSSKLLFEATSIFPKVFPEESTGTIERLSPNDEMNSIIAETSGGSSWEWAVNKWMPVTHPTFTNKNKSKWNRSGDREFQWDGETYELDATGSFQCDHVNSKRDNDDRQYHAICNRDGSISYRGSDNSWYSVSMSIPMPRRVPQGRVPQPADTIPESKSEVGWLKVDRHPRAGDKSLMSITFEGGEPRSVDLPFAIKDGLLDGVDNWDLERPLQANEDKTVIVRCQGSDLERKLDFTKDGTITILRPNAAKVANLNWNAPPASDGEFKLTNTSCTRVNKQPSVEFGTPTRSGFALLNPVEISPLGMKDNKLYWEQGGNLYCRTGEAPTGITDLGRVPISGNKSLKRIWQSSENGNPKLFFEKYGATFDLTKGELVQCIASPSASPICLASPPPESLIAKWFGDESIQDKSIQFDRAGKRPIEKMVFRLTDTAGPAFDHQKGVKHLKAKGDSVSTLSDDWQATYRFVDGQWGLETVVKANPAIKTIDLNNGLRADWTEAGYTVNNSKAMGKVEPWSTRALLGPTRVFVLKAGITEAGKNWWRTRKWDDTIVHRPEVMDGLPLATAYRAGDQLVSDNVAWALDNQGGIAKSGLRGSFDPPGMVDTVVTAWKVQLDKGGGACKIHYNERPLTVNNGAVDIDYAITAATSDEMVTLIDRGGVECLSMKASWSKHTDEVVAKLQDFQPTKTLTFGGDHLARVFKASGPLEYFQIPSTSDGALVPVPLKERAIESWTAGGILRASLDEDDKVRFTHVYPDGSEKKPFNYPAISRADAITHGRCACDYPIDVFRAKSDDQVWLKLKFTQSEVYEALDDQGKPIDLTTIKQDVAPSLFDRDGVAWIRDDKSIEARDDAERIAELSRAVKAALGKPKLWYRRGDRIFVVGESDAGWIEMSPRWSGLPLKH